MNDSANAGVIWEARGLWPVPIEWSNHETQHNESPTAGVQTEHYAANSRAHAKRHTAMERPGRGGGGIKPNRQLQCQPNPCHLVRHGAALVLHDLRVCLHDLRHCQQWLSGELEAPHGTFLCEGHGRDATSQHPTSEQSYRESSSECRVLLKHGQANIKPSLVASLAVGQKMCAHRRQLEQRSAALSCGCSCFYPAWPTLCLPFSLWRVSS